MKMLNTSRPALDTSTARVGLSGDERIRGSSLQAIRARIFKRDKYRCVCEECKATGALRPATVVDHKVPLWAGGQEHDGNRQSMSAECHNRKSKGEAQQLARGERPL